MCLSALLFFKSVFLREGEILIAILSLVAGKHAKNVFSNSNFIKFPSREDLQLFLVKYCVADQFYRLQLE